MAKNQYKVYTKVLFSLMREFMRHNLLFWQLFIPTCLILGLLVLVLYAEISESELNAQQQKIDQVTYQVNLLKIEIESELLSLERDLVRLRNEQAFTLFATLPTQANKHEIETSWVNMLKTHPNFQQIRYIDASGIEQVRVERQQSTNNVVATNEFQNKLDRPYVQSGLALNNSEILVSDFDLNQEFGEIELPIRPTIRFIIKFGDDPEHQGILVINYLCVGLFSNLDSLIDTQLRLINQDGYYLHSDDSNNNWGWLLGNDNATLRVQAPRLWFKLNRVTEFNVQNDGVDLFGKILLTPAGVNSRYPQLFYTYPLKANGANGFSLIENTYLWIILSCAVLFIGMMVWVFYTLVDLGKQRERAEQANYKAQMAVSVKSKFLANMSHEIRTPLNGIMGFLQLLALEPLNKKQLGFAESGLKSTHLLSQVLNDILDFSKLEANKLVLQHSAFSLESMINDVGVLMSGSLKDKRLELWLDIEPNLNLEVYGDEIRLRQILVNLTSNAVKFTEEGFVKIKVIQQAQTNSHISLKFEVSDSGIGINEEQLSRIFNSFEQASMEVNKKYGGTGLGLNITENLLTLMGSKLQVQSKPMVGSTFYFELTLEKATAPAPHISTEVTQQLNRRLMQQLQVLLYSTNTIGKNILEKICENFGWGSVHAASIESVLSILSQRHIGDDPRIDVVVVDKPKVDAKTWVELEQIRNCIEGNDAPLVYLLITLSSDLNQEFEEMQLNLIDGHFIKPLTPSIFFEEIAAKLLELDATPVSEQQYSTKDLEGIEILLVEDNFINQEVVSNMLTNLHAHTTIAENGKMALDILLAQPERFDLILMDMQMPVMDGVTATTHIRQELELTEIPIIAMTANAMESDKQMCFDAGMNDHLSKPFDQKMLIEKIIRNVANAL